MKSESLSWDALLTALEESPLIVDMHPVLYALLPSDVRVVKNTAEACWQLDSPSPGLPSKIIIRREDNLYRGRFPHVKCAHDPFSPDLNHLLLQRFDQVADCMLRQSSVSDRILSSVNNDTDIVIFMLVDGLSYDDARRVPATIDALVTANIEPCLVDVPSFTRAAFPNLVGSPSIAVRLFRRGYYDRFGFSYWTREDNELSDRIFVGIPEVQKVGDFDHIVHGVKAILAEETKGKKFIQILRIGLDGYAHSQKRFPPVEAVVNKVFDEFAALVALLQHTAMKSRLFLTADHGILWRNQFSPQVVGSSQSQSSSRYCGWRDVHELNPDYYRRLDWEDEELYCLGYPYLRRPLRIDEQGVHGGISYQESIVPYVSISL